MNDLMQSFEEWLSTVRKLYPEKGEIFTDKHLTHLHFVIFWKNYRDLTIPVMYKLLQKQFPKLAESPGLLEEAVYQNITNRIFETAEFAWKLARDYGQGVEAADLYPEIYQMAMDDLNTPKESPPYTFSERECIKGLSEQEKQEIEAEWIAGDKASVEWMTNFNAQVIDALQTHLLELLPGILNITAEYWKLYKFLMISECNDWKFTCNRHEYIISIGLGPEWIYRPYAEIDAEIARRKREG